MRGGYTMKMHKILLLIMAMMGMIVLASCSESSDNGTGPDKDLSPIVGQWRSEGENVALLLYSLGYRRIDATFKDDNTYVVVTYDTANATVTLEGTYTTEKSDVDDIYKITINQTKPVALTSEGIFKVDETKNPNEMLYEIVQTQPSIGATPPTPEAGFGSTNGGALGMINVQKYVKIAQ